MRNFYFIAVTFLAIVGCGTCLDIDSLITALDSNPNNEVTTDEIQQFYERFSPQPVTRCSFTDLMAQFDVSSKEASVLFDVMQTSDGKFLSMEELNTTILGKNAKSYPDKKTVYLNLQTFDLYSKDVLAAPYESGHTDNINLRLERDFRVSKLADITDANGDNLYDRVELRNMMLSTDANGDEDIRRCEFVDRMRLFGQNTAVASHLYDELFGVRDSTWAHVDSDFLLLQMNTKRTDAGVTKEEFRSFFLRHHSMASRAVYGTGNTGTNKDEASAIQGSMICMTLLLLFSCYFVY